MNFSSDDIAQLEKLGITTASAEEQIKNFEDGFPFADIVRPCTANDGIIQLEDDERERLVSLYDESCQHLDILKFVPASGAASRMFKELFNFYEEKKEDHPMADIMRKADKFGFYKLLEQTMSADGKDAKKDIFETAGYILNKPGLNYGNLPKGLIQFHNYDSGARTAFEEHLVEGALYAQGEGNKVNIHFTVSPEHLESIKKHLDRVIGNYEKIFDVTYEISFSVQSKSTNTIAVTPENEPFRNDDGTILFRPGGHGALLKNLNETPSDVIFIKNIDNIVPDRLKDTTIEYKKALAGLLIEKIRAIKAHLEGLNSDNSLDAAVKFIQHELGLSTDHIKTVDDAKEALDRPIRICGMVRNQGEPGGGPFWVKDVSGKVSKQIVETSQIDLDDSAKQNLVKNATHFNPVDLICSTKRFDGSAFDLMKFRDPNTGFISHKSKNGRELKAQELPGLWNGAMANWITLFVEVPVITFNPVKTVTDLLRDEHQPKK